MMTILTTPQNWQKDTRVVTPRNWWTRWQFELICTFILLHGMDHGLVWRIFFSHQKIATLLRAYQECSWKFWWFLSSVWKVWVVSLYLLYKVPFQSFNWAFHEFTKQCVWDTRKMLNRHKGFFSSVSAKQESTATFCFAHTPFAPIFVFGVYLDTTPCSTLKFDFY